MKNREKYKAGKAVIKDKNKLSEAMEKLAKLEDMEESVLENHEKNKVTDMDIIVRIIGDKPYYELKYKLLGENYYSIGYSSYFLNNVVEWKEKYFELVENENVLKWIPCSEKLPKKPEVDGYFDGYIVQTRHVMQPFSAYLDGIEWTDDDDDAVDDVIAWMPLPEPYREV